MEFNLFKIGSHGKLALISRQFREWSIPRMDWLECLGYVARAAVDMELLAVVLDSLLGGQALKNHGLAGKSQSIKHPANRIRCWGKAGA